MPINAVLWVLLVASIIFLVMAFGKVFKSKGFWARFTMIVGWILLAYSIIGLLSAFGVINLGGASALFLSVTGGTTPDTDGCPTGQSLVNGVCTVPPTSGLNTNVIATLKASVKEKNSDSYTNVGNDSGTAVYLYIYDAQTDPSSPTASYIDRLQIHNGSGSTTSKLINTNTPYRVVFNGNNMYYDKDFGVMTFASSSYNSYTGEYLYNMGDVAKIASISSPLNGIAIDGTVNGQTNYTNPNSEINQSAGSATIIYYNEANGDGQFYINPDIAFTGAYAEAKNPVMCFEWDTSTPPAGNEITSITAQLLTGTDFAIPSELVNYWGKQQCVLLGTAVKGGVSSSNQLTFTVVEANMDGTEIYYLDVDDLGGVRAKDVALNTGATIQRISIKSQ